MTTPAEVALDLSETSRAIARWSLPATLIERLPDETAVQTWTTLHRSVVESDIDATDDEDDDGDDAGES